MANSPLCIIPGWRQLGEFVVAMLLGVEVVGGFVGEVGVLVGVMLGAFVWSGSDKLIDIDTELCSTACIPRRIFVSEASNPR